MKNAKITWYTKLKENDEYNQSNDIYAGSYTKDSNIQVYMQVWNNRWGVEDVSSLNNFNINMYFENEEDYALLDYCTVILNNSEILTLNKTNKIGVLVFPDNFELSGVSNDGTTENNKDNYMTLEFTFKAPKETKLKVNDLKTLCFEIMQL